MSVRPEAKPCPACDAPGHTLTCRQVGADDTTWACETCGYRVTEPTDPQSPLGRILGAVESAQDGR